jgi:hypothetical protein
MKTLQQFGSASDRSGGGALLSSGIERIKNFLRYRGLLLAEGLGGWLVIVHPALAPEVDRRLVDVGLRRVILGASLEELRRAIDLTVGETRALEVLSPGPLVVAKGDGDASRAMLIAVPDSWDLRDIASASGGTARAFLQEGAARKAQLDDIVSACSAVHPAFPHLGVLESSSDSPTWRESPTVVRIAGPGAVDCLAQGVLAVDAVEAASALVSQWEIGDWT